MISEKISDNSNIKKMFDTIALRYDFLNDLISLGRHRGIKKCAIKNVPLQQEAKVLDLCTGTGDIALLFSEEMQVTAVDFSEKMLEIAKKRAKNRKNIRFLQADAMNLPFKDESFDAVFISFGLRNLPDLQKAVQEMKRVIKPGGYVINLDTGKPKGIIAPFFNFYFFKLVPLLGWAYRYLPESTLSFPSQEELVKIFSKNDLKDVKNYDYLFGTVAQQVGIK